MARTDIVIGKAGDKSGGRATVKLIQSGEAAMRHSANVAAELRYLPMPKSLPGNSVPCRTLTDHIRRYMLPIAARNLCRMVAVAGLVLVAACAHDSHPMLPGPISHCIDYGQSAVGSLDTPGEAVGVAVVGHFAYVADGPSGLEIIEVSNPESPNLVGGVDTPGYALRVVVSGSYAYVADGDLQIIDVSNPGAPNIVGTVETPGMASDVDLLSGVAYVADGTEGIQIVDVQDPTRPRLRGRISTPALDMVVMGSRAYVVCGSLCVIDVSDPFSPQLLGTVATGLYLRA